MIVKPEDANDCQFSTATGEYVTRFVLKLENSKCHTGIILIKGRVHTKFHIKQKSFHFGVDPPINLNNFHATFAVFILEYMYPTFNLFIFKNRFV